MSADRSTIETEQEPPRGIELAFALLHWAQTYQTAEEAGQIQKLASQVKEKWEKTVQEKAKPLTTTSFAVGLLIPAGLLILTPSGQEILRSLGMLGPFLGLAASTATAGILGFIGNEIGRRRAEPEANQELEEKISASSIQTKDQKLQRLLRPQRKESQLKL